MNRLRTEFLLSLIALFLFAALRPATAQETPNQLIQKGEPHQIPGCGVSGCYKSYDICVDVPPGTVPVAIAHFYDSFSGWGEFINQRQTPSGFCANYVQHSHNVTRIVSFDVLYQLKSPPGAVALSPTEAELLRRLKSGERLSLSGPARNISGNFLLVAISQLKDSQPLKTKGMEIDGAEFSDEVAITNTTVPFTIHLTNCRFGKRFSVRDVRFDGSLIIEDTTFEGSFQFQSAAVKEDLIVSAKTLPKQAPAFQIRDTRVDGRTEIATVTSGSVDNLKTGDLHFIAGTMIELLSLSHLDVNSFRADAAVVRTKIKELYTINSKVNTSMRVVGLDIDNFWAVWTTASELVLSNTAIDQGFNLSFSNLNSVEWAMGQKGNFPRKENNDLTGLVFKSLKITRADATENPVPNSQPAQGPESAEVTKTSLEMLNASQYSASAYDALEKLLAGRGDSQADEVFLAGREARRQSEIRTKPILGRFQWCLDLFQEYVLGYGRFARWPIIWSVVVIVVGFGFFWKETDMERKPQADSKYSRYWYSFELFVPVIDVGVASEWHPKPERTIIANYARLHKLAGWILVPVILAALTGFAK
jgi:hypothetical protein